MCSGTSRYQGITLTSTQKWGFLDFFLVVGDGSIDDDCFLAEETIQITDFMEVEAKTYLRKV